MIGYTTVGTNDFTRSAKFYDTLLGGIGAVRTMQAEDFIAWGKDSNNTMFSIHLPQDGKQATVGNGVMIALLAQDSHQVNAVHKQALELGAVDEGQPGPRGDQGFYAAYFRDLDGNKLNIHCMV
jgi:predicted lactoylglutathione lyase